ncbi:MAG: hypothetical protein LC749_11045 [Actinobacteria bacterium]|nr:hypothetical protein [Actinomycetota bacterium]
MCRADQDDLGELVVGFPDQTSAVHVARNADYGFNQLRDVREKLRA